MEFLRQTIDSDKLVNLFNLPNTLRGRKVDVIILPTANESEPLPKRTSSAYGRLNKYADPALIDREKGAWERAVAEKNANR
jgi:hypothetical protein